MGKCLALLGLVLGLSAIAQAGECRVFLVPGALGGSSGGSAFFVKPGEYFSEYVDFFRSKGCEVAQASFPPDSTIEERGLILRDQWDRFRKGGAGVLVAHSQGGLDARYALRALKLQGVRALVTIGTPHHGTPVASWAVWQREHGTVLYWVLRAVFGYDLKALSFAGEMTPEFLEKWKDKFTEVPGVTYASAVGACHSGCHWAFRVLRYWAMPGDEPGDGLVPASSQRFGQDLGEFDLDHLSEIARDPEKRTERLRFLNRAWDTEIAKFATAR